MVAAVVHAANTGAVLGTALDAASVFKLPVTWTRADGPPGSYTIDAPDTAFSVPLWVLCVVFSALALVDHVYYVVAEYKYTAQNGAPRRRSLMWYEYSYSATVMMVAIMLLCGVTDLGTIILACVSYWVAMRMPLTAEDTGGAAYSQLSTASEDKQDPAGHQTRARNENFVQGCVLCVGPWVPVFISCARASPPDFVYGIVVSLFVLFALFGIVQYLYITRGWSTLRRDCLLVVLSIVAKTTLLWQVYASALVMN